jgi:prophage regulatory protein
MSQTKFVSYPRLKELGINFSRVHLSRLERAGKFPRRVSISENRIAWVEAELEIFLQARANARQFERS